MSYSTVLTKRVYNILDKPLYAIDVFVEPVSISSNVMGHNELENGLYVLTGSQIAIKINDDTYILSLNEPGESFSNPISVKLESNTGYQDGILTNDNTLLAEDRMGYINHNIDYTNKTSNSYFLNGSFIEKSNDVVNIELMIDASITGQAKEALLDRLDKLRIVINDSLYKRQIVSVPCQIYGRDSIYIEDSDANIRW